MIDAILHILQVWLVVTSIYAVCVVIGCVLFRLRVVGAMVISGMAFGLYWGAIYLLAPPLSL